MKCRNCDEFGHGSRECPKPRDYSRVQCRNCGEMGHTIARCKQEVITKAEPVEGGGWEEAGETAGLGDSNAAASGNGWDANNGGSAW
jgi:cellular nucleic acid-binding protein